MIFEPEPGSFIQLHNETIKFVSLEPTGPASVFVYAESGREGTVYKVLKGNDYYALKVFYPEYRDKRLLQNTEKLSRFRHLEGFRVAERIMLTRETFPDVIEEYPDLNYAVLMPWIEGTLWGNLMMQNDLVLQREQYFTIAQALIRSVRNLEYQGVAHCDLSNNNFIIDKTHTAIQLIDVEDMYAPDMPRPIPDVSYGTIGYRTKWIAQQGLWAPEADRFASAILCSEIVTWHNEEIRDNRAGDSSFFDEDEIGEKSERYSLMVQYLCDLDKDLSILFDGAWFSQTLSDCPTAADWMDRLAKLGEPNHGAIAKSEAHTSPRELDQQTLIHFKTRKNPYAVHTPEIQQPLATETGQEEAGQDVQEELVNADIEVESQDMSASPENVNSIDVENESDTVDIPQEHEPEESLNIPEAIEAEFIPQGVPPRMEIDREILDFGRLNKQGASTLQLCISNTGGTLLKGTVQSENWINVSSREFHIAPGEQRLIAVSLNTNFPRPQTGLEYRTANALTIESNIGSEVIGARYTVAQPALYESTWKRTVIGAAVGLLFGCLIVTLSPFNGFSLVALPIVIVFCGLAGGIAYPAASSIIFSLVGFMAVEMIVMLLLLMSSGLRDLAAILLGLGAVIGFLAGAVVSRMFSWSSPSRRG